MQEYMTHPQETAVVVEKEVKVMDIVVELQSVW